jgi:hypothetical protein
MRKYQWQRKLIMSSVSKFTMDIKRIWAMKPTRDYIKELSDSILLGLQLVV